MYWIIVFNCLNALSKPLWVQLSGSPDVESAGVLTAYKKGIYKKDGLDVRPIFSGSVNADGVLTGESDVAVASGTELLAMVHNGFDVRAFAAQFQYDPRIELSQTQADSAYGEVFYASTTTLRERRNELVAFVNNTSKGWKNVYENIEDSAKEFAPTKEKLLRLKLLKRPLFDGDFGVMSAFRWEQMLAHAKGTGSIERESRLTGAELFVRIEP